MRPTKLEWTAIAVTAATVLAMACFFWGSSSGGSPVTITARSAPPAASVQPSPAQEAQAPEDGEPGPDPSPTVSFPVDLNTATLEELMALPAIGETRAQAILDHRAEHGPFTYVEDLREVKGIGEGILQGLMDYVTVGTGAADTP